MTAELEEKQGPQGFGGLFFGLVLTVVLHLTAGVVLNTVLKSRQGWETAGYMGLGVLMAIGVLQLVYMVPAILVFRGTSIAKGLIVGAALTFLLNATCWMVAAVGR